MTVRSRYSQQAFAASARVILAVLAETDLPPCGGCWGRDECEACDREAIARVLSDPDALARIWASANR